MLDSLCVAFSPRANATRFGAGANQRHEGVAIGKEAIPQRTKVDNQSLVWVMAVAVSADDGVDAEGIQGVVEVAEDQEGESDVA